MKKMICILGYAAALVLAGCQAQHDASNAGMDVGQIAPSGSSEAEIPSESTAVDAETEPNQAASKDNPGADAPSKDDSAITPTQPVPISGNISSIGNNSSDAAILDEREEERELKNEGSLRGEIEVTHKLSVGKMELSKGDTVLFHIEAKSADAKLKITLIGAGTSITLEDSVTGSGDISFEIDTAGEYAVMLENCSLRGVKFTIDYSIGGFI